MVSFKLFFTVLLNFHVIKICFLFFIFFFFFVFLLFLVNTFGRFFAEEDFICEGYIRDVMLMVDRGDFCDIEPYSNRPQNIGHNAVINAPYMVCLFTRCFYSINWYLWYAKGEILHSTYTKKY